MSRTPWVGRRFLLFRPEHTMDRTLRTELPGYPATENMLSLAMSNTLAYSLVIEFHADENGYLASFPALPGCHTWGATYEDAVKNAEEALLGYLEALQKNGEEIPREDHPIANVSLGVMVNLPAQA